MLGVCMCIKKIFLITSLAAFNFDSYANLLDVGDQYVEINGRDIINNDINDNPYRLLSFYSGYMNSQYNTYDLATFGLELLNAESYLLEKLDDSEPWKRNLVLFFSSYVYYMYQLAYHEIGHGLRVRAHGKDFQLNTETDLRTFSKDENFWKYIARCIFQCSPSGSTVHYAATGSDKDKARETLIIAAGGMNHETYLAERISDAIWHQKLYGKLPIAAYLWARASTLLYTLSSSTSPGHDVNNMATAANTLKLNVSKGNFRTAYTLALIGGTSYSMLKSLTSRNPDIETVTFNDFRIPDIFPYVTSNGISYKFVSGYRISDVATINFGYERVMHGNKKSEFTVGARYDMRFVEFEGNVSFGAGSLSGDILASANVAEKLKLSVRFSSYAQKSLIGERHTRDYYDGTGTTKKLKSRTNMVSVGLSYVYGR